MNYLSIKQVCEKFSVDRKTIWLWRNTKGFPLSVELAGLQKLLFLETEVDQWAAENSKRAEAA